MDAKEAAVTADKLKDAYKDVYVAVEDDKIVVYARRENRTFTPKSLRKLVINGDGKAVDALATVASSDEHWHELHQK